MFDWARGSTLQAMGREGIYNAGWNRTSSQWLNSYPPDYPYELPAPHEADAIARLNDRWLKSWSVGWLFGLVELGPQHRVLDVGSSYPTLAREMNYRSGCEVHVLDRDTRDAAVGHFGVSPEKQSQYPTVKFNIGLAGEDHLPAEHFDFITCISVVEHTYDACSPVDTTGRMGHLNVLRDMVRMLKPGGVLLMNWDHYLEGVPHHYGWDFEFDYRVMRHCGLTLLDPRRRVRGKQYIADHPDSLFFDPEVLHEMSPGMVARAASITMLFRKPGPKTLLNLRIRPHLESVYFPEDEVTNRPGPVQDDSLTTDQIEYRFRSVIDHCREMFGPIGP